MSLQYTYLNAYFMESCTVFENKTLTITGGTGSFGNAVLRRFLETEVKEIRIFSRDEKKQEDMRKLYNNPKLKFYIGDVRDVNSLVDVMRGVDYVWIYLLLVPSTLHLFPIGDFHPHYS